MDRGILECHEITGSFGKTIRSLKTKLPSKESQVSLDLAHLTIPATLISCLEAPGGKHLLDTHAPLDFRAQLMVLLIITLRNLQGKIS